MVLAYSHSHSLQLPCTVGSNQARSHARSEFKILEPSPKGGGEAGRAQSCILAHDTTDFATVRGSPNRHQLYIVIVANACACTPEDQALFTITLPQ